jgi:hypothetical protein
MFTRALFEYGSSSSAIRTVCSRFKSRLYQFFREILITILKRTGRAGGDDDGHSD